MHWKPHSFVQKPQTAKKAFDILILDLRKLTYIADYFVICSGSNTTQVSAIADWIGQAWQKQASVLPMWKGRPSPAGC